MSKTKPAKHSIQHQSNPPPKPVVPPCDLRYLRIDQAAGYFNCSISEIRRLIYSGKLPAKKLGVPWVIDRLDLDRLFASEKGRR